MISLVIYIPNVNFASYKLKIREGKTKYIYIYIICGYTYIAIHAKYIAFIELYVTYKKDCYNVTLHTDIKQHRTLG